MHVFSGLTLATLRGLYSIPIEIRLTVYLAPSILSVHAQEA
jgi:hypothetical protein